MRIEFPPFFSVDPVDGLMIATNKKEKFSKGDMIADIFTTQFGRELQLAFLGGFENGVRLTLSSEWDYPYEQFKQIDLSEIAKTMPDHNIAVQKPGLLVLETKKVIDGTSVRIYKFIVCKGIVSTYLDLDEMSRAEASFYHNLFLSAQPMEEGGGEGAQEAPENKQEQKKPQAPAADLKAEGEQLISARRNEEKNILNQYRSKLNALYMECNNSDVSQMYRVRSRFRSQVNDSGYELRSCLNKFSQNAENLVKRGADIAFIRKVIAEIRSALDEMALEVNVDTGDYGEWDIKYSIPSDVQALPAKWEGILNNHPDIAAERLKDAREAEEKRLNNRINLLSKHIPVLQAEESDRQAAARQAEKAYNESAASLKERIAQSDARFDRTIKEQEDQKASLKQEKAKAEQDIQQARSEHARAFFLAFGKKKALLAQIDTLTQKVSRLGQQISDQDKKIDETRKNKKNEAEKIEQAHAALKEAMEQAQQHLDSLPEEIADAQYDLDTAQKRLEKLPGMSLKEINSKPASRYTMSGTKPQSDANPRQMTPTQKENAKFEEKILEVLAYSDGMTVSEIMSSDPALDPTRISATRVSAILRNMCLRGQIEREERMRKAYFRIK